MCMYPIVNTIVMQLSKLVSEADRNDMQIMKKILMDKGIYNN